MKAVILNKGSSKLTPGLESVSLRIAYLICEKVMPAGASYDAIQFEEIEKNLELETKVRLIEAFRKEDKEEDNWSAEEVLQTLKEYRKMKHPPPGVIKQRKIFEKGLNELFQQYFDATKSSLAKSGFMPLAKLLNTSVNGGYRIVGEADEAKRPDDVPLSALLMRRHATAAGEFFFLHPAFFNACKEENWFIPMKSDGSNAKKKGTYLQHLFTLPNINLLSATELETTKSRLSDSASILETKLNQWMQDVYSGKESSSTAFFFNKEVLPATAGFLHAIAVNDVLNHASRMQKDMVSIDVFAGELPAETVWQFYKWANVLEEGTWQILQKALKEDGYSGRRFPVMTVAITNELTVGEKPAKQAGEEFKIMPVKKSIDIG
jgi:hypothetical protein